MSAHCNPPGMQTISASTGAGTWTPCLLRRSAAGYAAICALGLLPFLLNAPAWLQAAGMGLWWPGAGFIAVGGWSVLWILPTWFLMAAALFAWFGSGMNVAPPFIWLAGALVAGASTHGAIWPPAPYVIVSITAAFAMVLPIRLRRRRKDQWDRGDRRNDYLPEEIPLVSARMDEARKRQPEGRDDELTPEQLSSLRYALDRAIQPIDDFRGFDSIDQFQTSALRYQINQLGWALAVAQGRYAPNFHGYLSEAQRRLIERYLQPRVLSYWKWESLWGHLNTDPDPVGRDNIMLTGYIGINLALYMGNTGDRRYMEPGSLVFRVSDRHVYRHSAAAVVDSLLQNYRRYHEKFCLYPCEPNWVYSACNMRGAATLAAFDRALGSSHWASLEERFLQRLESDFMTPDGSVIALRSNLTGFSVPFPMPDSVLAKELNPILPELAKRYWAIVRKESLSLRDGKWQAEIPGKNVDYGNYTAGDIFTLGGFFGSAREMGDDEVADAILARIDSTQNRRVEDGVLRYEGASTLANATMAMDRLLRCDGWRDAITRPLPECVFRGPLLAGARYPEVLVAKAFSDGTDLRLVLYPGKEFGLQSLRIERLNPGGTYRVDGATEDRIAADADGTADVTVQLGGRHEMRIVPVA